MEQFSKTIVILTTFYVRVISEPLSILIIKHKLKCVPPKDLGGGCGRAEPIMGCWANDVDKYVPGFATEYLHT